MAQYICPECEQVVAQEDKYCPGCSCALSDRATEFSLFDDSEDAPVFEELDEDLNKNHGLLLLAIVAAVVGAFAVFNGSKFGVPFLLGGLLVFIFCKFGRGYFVG